MEALPRPTSEPGASRLLRSFYATPADVLARRLIGTVLVRRVGNVARRGRIVETEAYVGEHDLACHAAKGRTARTNVMFGPAGHAYVYLIYGIHHMLNVVAADVGDAQAVLIRAAEPLDGWAVNLSGPGNVAKHFSITRADYGLDLTTSPTLFIEPSANVVPPTVATTARVGVDYAGEWVDAPLRFFDVKSRAVSKRPKGIDLV